MERGAKTEGEEHKVYAGWDGWRRDGMERGRDGEGGSSCEGERACHPRYASTHYHKVKGLALCRLS